MDRLFGHDIDPRPQIKVYLTDGTSADLYVKVRGSQIFVQNLVYLRQLGSPYPPRSFQRDGQHLTIYFIILQQLPEGNVGPMLVQVGCDVVMRIVDHSRCLNSSILLRLCAR